MVFAKNLHRVALFILALSTLAASGVCFLPATSHFESLTTFNNGKQLTTAWILSGTRTATTLRNIYDDWRSDAVVDIVLPLNEKNVRICLEEFVQSEYGKQMFGCHALAASYGITGAIDFVEVAGPEVILALSGAFWHKRSTVLGRAAVWLNARMPEIVHVNVLDSAELEDFENVVDDLSGEVLYVKDKRAEDFNGDRGTMEYQGIDPDVRGPFPQGPMTSGGMISPA